MKLVDVNVLVYVASRQSDFHKQALKWWTAAFDGDEPVGLCWHALIGFVRIIDRKSVV